MSVPSHASTSSTNTSVGVLNPPHSAPNSDGTHQTILGSPYALLRGLYAVLRSFISRLCGVDFVASLHNIYAYLTGLLLSLTEIKYQGSSTNPFSEHPTLMTLFLIAILIYIISLITLRRSNHMSDLSSKLLAGLCHICGAVACELLLLVLVSPVTSLVINVSSLTLIVMLVLCYKYLLRRILDAEEEGTGISQSDAGDQASQMEMVDLQAAA